MQPELYPDDDDGPGEDVSERDSLSGSRTPDDVNYSRTITVTPESGRVFYSNANEHDDDEDPDDDD
jgi:hypothetical protein